MAGVARGDGRDGSNGTAATAEVPAGETLGGGGGEDIGLPSEAPLTKHKVVFVGDSGVGKTSIIHHFIHGTFVDRYKTTIGIDFKSKTLYLSDSTVRLQIWDSAGQERFRSLIPSYIRDCYVCIVVYDVTNRASFLNVPQWVDDVRGLREDVLLMLVGNKTDATDRRKVRTEEGYAKARELGTLFIETSAMQGSNITALFRRVAHALPSQEADAAVADQNLIDLRVMPKPPKDDVDAGAGGCGC